MEDLFESKYIKIIITKLYKNIDYLIGITDKKFDISNIEILQLILVIRSELILINASSKGRNLEIYKKINKLLDYLIELKLLKKINQLYPNIDALLFEIFLKLRNFPYILSNNLIDYFKSSEIKYEKKYYLDNNWMIPEQINIYNKIINSNNLILSLPTSFGKSFLVRTAVEHLLKIIIKNIMIVVPTNALINEYVDYFNKKLNNTKIITEVYQEISISSNLFIVTQEKALAILVKHKKLKINWLIIDEFYNIDLSNIRAQILFIIINLIYNNNQNIKTTFLLPGITNSISLVKKINYKIADKSEVHEVSNSLTSRDMFLFVTDKFSVSKNNFLETDWENINTSLDSTDKNTISILYKISEKITKNKKNQNFLIYAPKTKMISYAGELYNYLPNKGKISNQLEILIKYLKNSYGEQYEIIKYLYKGIGIHKGETDDFTRYILEREFKNKNINFLFCSSTLLQGVNLNTKYLFILTDRMPNKELFRKVDARNLLGRIGRINSYPHGFGFYISSRDSKNIREIALDKAKIENQIIDKSYLEKNKNIENNKKIIKINIFLQKLKNDKNIKFYSSYLINKDNELENPNNSTFLQDYFLEKKVDNQMTEKINLIKSQLKICIKKIFSKNDNFDLNSFKDWSTSIINLKIFNKDEISFEIPKDEIITHKYEYLQYCLFLISAINFVYQEDWSSGKIYLLAKTLFEYFHDYSIKAIANLRADFYLKNNSNNNIEKYYYNGTRIEKKEISNINNRDEIFDKKNNKHMTILLDNLITMISKEIEYTVSQYIHNLSSKIFNEKEIKDIEKQIETLTNNEKTQYLLELNIFKRIAIVLSTSEFDNCFYKDSEKHIFFQQDVIIKNLIKKLKKTESQDKKYIIGYLEDRFNYEQNNN